MLVLIIRHKKVDPNSCSAPCDHSMFCKAKLNVWEESAGAKVPWSISWGTAPNTSLSRTALLTEILYPARRRAEREGGRQA